MKMKNEYQEIWKRTYRNARLSRNSRKEFVRETNEVAQEKLQEALRNQLWARRYMGSNAPKDTSTALLREATDIALRAKKTYIYRVPGVPWNLVYEMECFAENCNPRRRFVPVVATCAVTGNVYKTSESRYISVDGLGMLAGAGMDVFEERHGQCMPGNMIFSEGAWTGHSNLMIGSSPFRAAGRGRFVSPEGADQLLREYGRIRGWLIAAADLSGVARVIKKTQTTRGVNSPYTKLYLPQMWEKYPSPGHLERKLWKVRRRAEAILSAFEGDYDPSWNDVAHATLKTRQVGKAAIIVVAETLAGGKHRDRFRNYAAARDFLASIRTAAFPVADNSDGVAARRETEPRLRKLNISVYRIRVARKYGRFSLKWLVRTDAGRTFHFGSDGPEEALHRAILAWKRQNELAAENADIVGFLRGDELGFCPLITREDSYEAGNCRVGTESWARQQGWGDREFVPGVWLINHLHDEEVRRVVVSARERRIGTEYEVA